MHFTCLTLNVKVLCSWPDRLKHRAWPLSMGPFSVRTIYQEVRLLERDLLCVCVCVCVCVVYF